MSPDEQTAAMVTAKLTGERFVAAPMEPPTWGWCVLDTENFIRTFGCATLESTLTRVRGLNEFYAKAAKASK